MSDKRRVSGFVTTFLSFGLFLYFSFHLVHGDRGWLVRQGLESRLAEAENRYEALRADREELEHRVRLLRPESLDPDMLEERTRAVLGYGKSTEQVFIFSEK